MLTRQELETKIQECVDQEQAVIAEANAQLQEMAKQLQQVQIDYNQSVRNLEANANNKIGRIQERADMYREQLANLPKDESSQMDVTHVEGQTGNILPMPEVKR